MEHTTKPENQDLKRQVNHNETSKSRPIPMPRPSQTVKARHADEGSGSDSSKSPPLYVNVQSVKLSSRRQRLVTGQDGHNDDKKLCENISEPVSGRVTALYPPVAVPAVNPSKPPARPLPPPPPLDYSPQQRLATEQDGYNEELYQNIHEPSHITAPPPTPVVSTVNPSEPPFRQAPPTPPPLDYGAKVSDKVFNEFSYDVPGPVYGDTALQPQVVVSKANPSPAKHPPPLPPLRYRESEDLYEEPTCFNEAQGSKKSSNAQHDTMLKFLDVDKDREVEPHVVPTYGVKTGFYDDNLKAPDKSVIPRMIDENAPITENRKSIFHLLRKELEYPSASHRKALTQALEKAKNPFEERNEFNESLLTVTTRVGNLEVLKFLLKHQGNLNVHDNNMMYPIHTAALYGHNTLLEYMINHQVNINMPGNKGNTPLHYATLNKKVATIDYLLRMNANVMARNHNGKKPYDLARENQHKQSLQHLEDAMRRKAGKDFEHTRDQAERNPPQKKVHEHLLRMSKDIELQGQKIENLRDEKQRESQYMKMEIETIKENAKEQEQKITTIETEYAEHSKTYYTHIMAELQSQRHERENMYTYPNDHNLPPSLKMVPSCPGGMDANPHQKFPPEAPMPHSQTCPDFGDQRGHQDEADTYEQVKEEQLEGFQDKGKLSLQDKEKIQRNYAQIVRNAKIKRIDAELLSEFVIDFEIKNHWKTSSNERDIAEQFLEILMYGTMEQLSKAKAILTSNNQADIANLLP